ncbi:hypothetical protein A9K71_03075 [Mesorhizobium sp. WSM3873]|nr:hypothetical protein A9K71_03075 [Mesorhizobium sp. WSM3873]
MVRGADFIGVAESVILADFVGIGVSFAFEGQRTQTEKVGLAPKLPALNPDIGRDIRWDLNHGRHHLRRRSPGRRSVRSTFFDRHGPAECNYPAAASFYAISNRR